MAAGWGQLITSIFGAGNSESGTQFGSGYNVNLTHDNSLNQSKGVQTGKTKGVTTSTGRTNQTTTGEQTGTTTTGGITTTVGTADKGALDAERGIASTALQNANDPSKTASLVKGILNKAAVTFGQGQGGEGVASGVYNSSTEKLLTGYAQGQAVADSAGAVLNYQQGEQQIAQGAEGAVIDATKGATTTSSTTQNSTLDTVSQLLGLTQDQGTTQQSNIDKNRTSDNVVNNQQVHGKHGMQGGSQQSGDSGGVFSSLSLVCAEMLRQDKMDLKLWYMVNRHFIDKVGPNGKEGYWMWAGPVAYFVKRNPDHWFTKVMFWLTEERACYVAAKFLRRRKYSVTLKGWFAYNMIFYFSYFLAGLSYIPRNIHHWNNGTTMGSSSKAMLGVR